MISISVAVDLNFAIGKENELLCHLPEDLKHFKQITMGKPIVMGRKTFDSLPKKPLPGRENYCITRREFSFQGVKKLSSIDEVIELGSREDIFVIGGGEIFASILPYSKNIFLTQIHHTFEGADVFFPPISLMEWKEVSREQHFTDEKNPYHFDFVLYKRIYDYPHLGDRFLL